MGIHLPAPVPAGPAGTRQSRSTYGGILIAGARIMSILDSFIAIDLETSGLEPPGAEILEIGAVRVEHGRIVDRFQTYVKPAGRITDETVRLTGITSDTVRDAPPVDAAIGGFRSFVTDMPLIAHHGRFESRFLDVAGDSPIENSVHSVRELARAALPTLHEHRVETLAEHFSVDSNAPHKALNDAETLAGIYLDLVELLRSVSLQSKQQMLRLLQGSGSGLLPVLVELASEGARREFLSSKPGGRLPDGTLFNAGGETLQTQGEPSDQPLDVKAVSQMLEPGGSFEDGISGYEYRPQQVEMARAVTEAFNNGRHLAVEAGTGVGKSIAYLAPSILYAVRNNVRFIVSTNTKNLQEQLFFKDLPVLTAILDVPFRYALLKGRNNYICLNRWASALNNPDASLTPYERIGALPLVLWAETTRTGDITENTGFDAVRQASLWAKICSDPGFCRSQRCRNNGRCFASNIRRTSARAHLVVINHSLLFSDLVTENAILGEFSHLVLDEAHNLEKVAAHYLGKELSIWRVRNITDPLCGPGSSDAGTLPALRHWIATSDPDPATARAFDAGIKAATAAAQDLWLRARTFFEDLSQHFVKHAGRPGSEFREKIRYRPGESTFDALTESLDPFLHALGALCSRLKDLSDWLRDLPGDTFVNQDEICNELGGCIETTQTVLDDLNDLVTANDENAVYWLELPVREKSADTRLFSAPLDVSGMLNGGLYEGKSSIVFTSATLGIRGKLTYFLRRMGLESMPGTRLQTLCLGSPFDYGKQALVCAPRFMPSPKSSEYQQAVAALLHKLMLKTKRGTLALFTSYGMLNRTYDAIKPDLRSNGVLVLGQGIDGSRTNITDRFKLEETAMLLGTDSFWEGIDVPGNALQVLGIVRLPFAVPSEPLVAAHIEELEKQGKDPFLNYSVPEAILKFRQGFGRLIRNKTDRGAVVVLDSRVLSTRYGRAFLEALPVGHHAFNSQEEMIGAIADWFEDTNGTNH